MQAHIPKISSLKLKAVQGQYPGPQGLSGSSIQGVQRKGIHESCQADEKPLTSKGGWRSKIREEGQILQEALSWEIREMSSDGVQVERRGWLAVTGKGPRRRLNLPALRAEGLSGRHCTPSCHTPPDQEGTSEQRDRVGSFACAHARVCAGAARLQVVCSPP